MVSALISLNCGKWVRYCGHISEDLVKWRSSHDIDYKPTLDQVNPLVFRKLLTCSRSNAVGQKLKFTCIPYSFLQYSLS